MDTSYQSLISPRETEENLSGLNVTTTSRTMGDLTTEVQELKRENFNLKLRIFFLEDQPDLNTTNTLSTPIQRHRSPVKYESKDSITGNRNDQVYQTTSPTGHQPHTRPIVIQTSIENDELRALRDELKKYKQENDELRQLLHESNQSGIITLKKSHSDQDTETTTTRISPDSIPDTSMPVSTYTVHFKQRELEEKIDLLTNENNALKSELKRTNNELKRVTEQYKSEFRKNEEQQKKADHVLRRLEADYDERIANLQKEQQRKLAEYESYRHEQEPSNSNANVEEYLRKIEDQERIIKRLDKELIAARKPIQYTVVETTSNVPLTDENLQQLNQTQIYYGIICQLREECAELRQSEKVLRRKIDELNRLSDLTHRRKSPSVIEDPQHIEDPRSFVAQISLQLQHDAENVSGLTNRIGEIIRQRDDFANQLQEKDAQISQFERREYEVKNQIRQQYELKIEGLQRELHDLQEQNKTKTHGKDAQISHYERREFEVKNQLREQYERKIEDLQEQIKTDNNRFRKISDEYQEYKIQKDQEFTDLKRRLNQEQDQLRIANDRYDTLEQRFTNDQQRYNELRQDYENAKRILESKNIEALETIVQQRNRLEQERDNEIENARRAENALETYTNRYNNLEIQYTQLQSDIDEQQTNYEEKIQNYHHEISQLKQERNDLNNEIQQLKYNLEDQNRDCEIRLNDLKRINDDLQSQVDVLKVRFHDKEDDTKRSRQEYQQAIDELDDLRRKYNKAINDLQNAENRINQIETDNHTLNDENTKLIKELDELEIKIRIRINEEYENEYRSRYNELQERQTMEIQNVQRDTSAIVSDLQEANRQRRHFEEQFHTVENDLQKAMKTIEKYKRDIDYLNDDLNISNDKHIQLENDLSRSYDEIQKLKIQNERLQESENQNRTYKIQFEQQLYDRQDIINQLERKIRDQEELIKVLETRPDRNEVKDLQLKLQIRIDQLEQDVEVKERFIQTYNQTIQARDQYIETLLDDIKQGDSSRSSAIESLREQIQFRDRQIDELLNEKATASHEFEQNINELRLIIQDRENRLAQINGKIQQTEQTIYTKELDINDLIQERDRLVIRLNLAAQERELDSDRIRNLENHLEMEKKLRETIPSEQHQHYQTVIDDLKIKLRQREDSLQRQKTSTVSIESVQNSLRISEEELVVVRQESNRFQTEFNRLQHRKDQMEKDFAFDLENRDQIITSLKQKVSDKEDEINKLHNINLIKDQKINELYLKGGNTDLPTYPDDNLSTITSLRFDLQNKDREIHELKQKLNRPKSPPSTSVIKEPKYKPSPDLDHLNREELLFELKMAIQHNEYLNEQLNDKSPKRVTEIHNHVVEIRHELARQKYVNQVLWRKLNALIDIHGSNTRAELAIELANYQDELAKLRLQTNRTNDARSAIFNAASRSSSEQNLSSLYNGLSSTNGEFPTKNIKSTISLLERSNIEWQTKLARLTEQLGRSESQSRNYQRELTKYQKLLYEAGLTENSIRKRRRSSDDSIIIGLYEPNKYYDDLSKIDNIDDLKEILRNQRKYIQQLQMRVRINTPDIIELPTVEKLNEQIQNLNLVIETYKNESNLLKNELKKLYKTIENDRKTLQQYEKLLKEQQTSIEQSQQRLNKYQQLFTKFDIHLPIFDETKDQQLIDPFDDYIIDLDIDIIQSDDMKKKTSFGRKDKDSAFGSTTDIHDQQRQIIDRDNTIRDLQNELTKQDNQIHQLKDQLAKERIHDDYVNQHRNDIEKIRQDLTRQGHFQQPDTKGDYDRIEKENQRLRAEIKRLETDADSNHSLITHYKTQLDVIQRQTPIHVDDKTEVILRRNDLLEEIALLRRNLERSMEKQHELQLKLDENIRHSRTPREFTFSGRGVSYPDLRLVDASGLLNPENISSSIYETRTKPLTSSSTTEFEHIQYPIETERITIPMRSYAVGEIKVHNDLRQLIEDIKFDLKNVLPEIKDKLRSRTDISIKSIEEHMNLIDEHLTHSLDLFETYWRADLPERNQYNEHISTDYHLAEENKRLLSMHQKYTQDIQLLRQKYKEQSNYLDQLLAQLTKANQKKADTGEYLALLLRPTLDVLQKARTNIEHHLKETHTNTVPPGSAQSARRHRHKRQE